MKTIFWNLTALLFLLTGCTSSLDKEDNEDDIIFDFVNYSIPILVTDANGNNLLDPKVTGNILDNKIKVIYHDKTYERLSPGQIVPRFNMPNPLGLRTETSQGSSATLWRLTFGEFSPTANYHDESFIIDWGDGTTDNIKFDCYITWKSKKEPNVHFTVYLNDVEWKKASPITITKVSVK